MKFRQFYPIIMLILVTGWAYFIQLDYIKHDLVWVIVDTFFLAWSTWVMMEYAIDNINKMFVKE